MSEIPSPKPSNLSKQSIYSLAETVAQNLDFKPGDDLIPIVSKLGGGVSYKDFWRLDAGDSGSLEIESDGKFTIFVAANTSSLRDRFTIAHELGHFILHFLWRNANSDDKIKCMNATRYGSDRAEWEANWFAAAFLMPSQEFTELYNLHGDDFVSLANHFDVSVKAAQTRAKALELIN